jgi:general secretion pathway protein A
MYTDYFKLSEPPFSLTPDPRYLFMSERHREGLAHLFYGVQQPGGFVQLTGDIGSGKTTLCRCMVKQLPPATDVALILNPRLTVIELLATVCDELGIPYPPDTTSNKVLIDALNQRLLESHAQHKRTVLIIDEAQNLHEDVLEQIRLLTNLETSKEKLLQVILIGQPELLTILKGKKLRQLSQRITAHYHLLPLSKSETYAYIQHRLRVAGRSEPLFTSYAMRRIYRLSHGIPRVINIICDRALLGAYALDRPRIGAGIIRQASREARGIVPWHRRFRAAWIYGLLALLILLILGALFLASNKRSLFQRESQSPVASKIKTPADNANLILSTKAEKPSESPKPDPIVTVKPPVTNPIPPVSKRAPVVSTPKAQIEPAKTNADPSPPNKAPPNSRIRDILKGAVSHGNSDTSFDSLYSRWGAQISLRPSELGCKVALTHGFECIFQTGDWSKLRKYDLPAILELQLPDGMRRRATLVGLTDETATLAIEKQEYEFPLSEIDEVWRGSFILIWKPPFAAHRLALGDKSKDVVWIRHALDALEGKTSSPGDAELYDENLKQRVTAFQRNRSLVQDGRVGNETLVRIALALKESGTPSISHRTRQ